MNKNSNFKSFAVIGLGRFGTRLATSLYDAGMDVLAIDAQEANVNAVADRVTRSVAADAKNKKVLESLGVKDCDCAVVAIGEDIASSVMIAMNLKALGIGYIVAKSSSETHSEVLKALGVNQVLTPELEMAERLAKNLSSRNIMEYIELSDEYAIVERPLPKTWDNKTILELNIRAKYGINIIGLKRGDDILVSPAPSLLLHEGDVLMVLGNTDSLKKLDRLKA